MVVSARPQPANPLGQPGHLARMAHRDYQRDYTTDGFGPPRATPDPSRATGPKTRRSQNRLLSDPAQTGGGSPGDELAAMDPFMQVAAAQAGYVARRIEKSMTRSDVSLEDARLAICDLATEVRILADIVVQVAGDVQE